MLKILNSRHKQTQQAALADMFRLRKKVFHDLLKWDVVVQGDFEMDHYDDANPIYVLSYDDRTGRLRGSLRLLPTLGPNMLDDTFPILLDGKPAIRDIAMWESSRFCIDPEISLDRSSNQVSIAAAELMCGVGELALASGLTHIVTVTDVFLERMFRRMGCPGERIGAPHKIGSVHAVAIAWEIDTGMLDAMKNIAAITGRLLDTPMSLEQARAA
ncbi:MULTISPECIES: acyl-homoserine-lactone synthase [Rhizobium/Agrobacterium group]|uniref:Acyl-homoserine-lactone synthase n=2 Tax=Rhizobium/Agrobacterium group TaxID=227290 RepID=B9JVS4_ALLAM|nr:MULTISPECIES: acyl-homoserine-lactone synthase [Rhizobium/Agrobacterium group]ACM36354.1 autoinducer synthesis protein [Allorhizobium ampelinum S4]MCF1449783.1 autoinducer synthase [Allorhizobium ampelinum]MCF1494757.1 autoinducer synthase [Allorhizobium ampelinum]MUO27764.1 autoinducer synthase [Agrobacterium vitis]MUO44176.1 autoinducer synthase [Agrobacterium vitis]